MHDIDLQIICEYFSKIDRQGPGSPEITRKALSFIEGLDASSKIADLGCGTGGQTIELAKNTKGMVYGLDLFPLFIEIFQKNINASGLQNRLKAMVGSMDNLPFQEGELDLIWSEGAVYNIGFEAGLKYWHRFLKDGGYVAVSEASWFTDERPKEIQDFWEMEYPGIDTVSNKVAQMQSAGYIPVASFILPESCWIENFHEPQAFIQHDFLRDNYGNIAAKELVDRQNFEIRLYEKYKKYYGYAFYIGRKI